MAELVQSHAAPDLLTFDFIDMDPEQRAQGAVYGKVARIGTTAVPVYTPDGLVTGVVTLAVADLRKLLKASYQLGWNGKALHVRGLMDKMPAEIGI